ncbi:hypothetical protein HGA88_02925 [Candidatus Roizmanbacteria bacterium]|nr:hypothetical protein [Candidatus Roizmanbacteria bacterium]
MVKNSIIGIVGLCIGIGIAVMVYSSGLDRLRSPVENIFSPFSSKKQVIGFFPYWAQETATSDYSSLTTFAYFGLTVGSDGAIVKMNNEQEENTGWHLLNSGALQDRFSLAKKNGQSLSLVVFNGVEDSIHQLISDPRAHADTLMNEVIPIMKKHGFTDLNIDIESTTEASDEARLHFTEFIQEIRKSMKEQNAGTVTIDVSPIVLVKKYLVDVPSITSFVDQIVFMTYDYHYQGSSVSGPVAPLYGGATISEFDVAQAMQEAIKTLPKEKIIMGIPLYGYEWETIGDTPRSAVIPGSGLAASNRRVENLFKECTTCTLAEEKEAIEHYVVYKDETTHVFHQIYFPDIKSMQAKLQFATDLNLGGVALWALGYEGSTILNPLKDYKK